MRCIGYMVGGDTMSVTLQCVLVILLGQLWHLTLHTVATSFDVVRVAGAGRVNWWQLPPCNFFSDYVVRISDYVVRVATGLLQGERQLNNRRRCRSVGRVCDRAETESHAATELCVDERTRDKIHSDREITTSLNKRGNDAADALASSAAAHHAAPKALIQTATKRRRVALTTHIFVADLLLQRRDVLRSMSEVDPG